MAKRAILAVFSLLLVIFGGTTAFMLVEGWEFWRAFFFTLITVTTVGYGAEGISIQGERVAAVLLVGGIGTATFAFGIIMRWAVNAQLAWRRKMNNRIGKLNDHYIICGFGRIGKTVTQRLAEADLQFVVIDGEQEAIEDAKAKGFLTIRGNATEDEILISAGLERAKGIVCAVNSDSSNIVITLGARELRPDIRIFARVDEDGAARKIRRAGATHIVSPFRTGAIDIANAIIHPNLSEFLQFSEVGKGSFEMSEITVSSASKAVGKSLASLHDSKVKQVVYVAIKRSDGSTIIGPADSTILEPKDVVIIGGISEDVEKIFNQLCTPGKSNSKSPEQKVTTWAPKSPFEE